jgi:repressor LexA
MQADRLSSDLVFQYVRDYIEQHGYPPSMRNIAQDCQMSVSTVCYNLDKLEAWGWLTRQPHMPRSLRILRQKKGA